MDYENDTLVHGDGYDQGYDEGYFNGFEAALNVVRKSPSQSKLGLVNELERVYMVEIMEDEWKR